jgi:hypothetical protein
MNPLSDKVVSLLRTVVPVIWGSAIAWLLTVIALPTPVTGFLTNQTDLVVVVAIAGWYAGFRWLEPKLPAWLTRIVLGSNQTPTYAPVVAVTPVVAKSPEQLTADAAARAFAKDPSTPVTPPVG